MTARHTPFILCTVMLSLALASIVPVYATVTKSLQLDSDPPGAQVFFKQAGRETPLGTTPLKYQAEFHSGQSILRFVFKIPGQKPVTLEVSATQDSAVAKFEKAQITLDPADHKEPKLRDIQLKLNPLLEKEIPELLAAESTVEALVSEPVRVEDFDGEIGLVIRLAVEAVKISPEDEGSSRQENLLKTLWGRLGSSLVLPLAAKLREGGDVGQISLVARFSEQRIRFRVDARTETKIEMRCMPGTDYYTELVQDYCAYRDLKGNCVSQQKSVNKSRYNPCKTQIPITKTEVKLDPKVQSGRDLTTAYYAVPLSAFDKEGGREADKLYDKISVLLTDSSGKHLKEQGTIPKALLAPSR